MMKAYLSNTTRERAKQALDDLSTEELLAVVRQAPVPDYRAKEIDMSLQKDMADHKKMFRARTDDTPTAPKKPIDPIKALNAMKYTRVEAGKSVGDKKGMASSREAPEPKEGDPLGPMRVEKPKLEKTKLPVYEGFRLTGDQSEPSDEGGGSNNAVT